MLIFGRGLSLYLWGVSLAAVVVRENGLAFAGLGATSIAVALAWSHKEDRQ